MSNIPLIGQREQAKNEPMFRLLHCLVCGTLEELPPRSEEHTSELQSH